MAVQRDTSPVLQRLPPHSHIVDSPHLIQFEKTSIGQPSDLLRHLLKFHDVVVHFPQTNATQSVERTRLLLDYMAPRTRVFASKLGMRIAGTVNVGSAFDHTQAIGASDTDVLMLFHNYGMRTDGASMGYRVIPLKRHRYKMGSGSVDQWRFGRSESGRFLSPVATARSMHAVIERSLLPCTEFTVREFLPSDGRVVVLMNKGKQQLNIIPGTYIECRDLYLTTQPYAYDENPHSDTLWRLSYAHKEVLVIDRMTRADRGMYTKALRIMKALFAMEPTLFGLTSYQLKTILLHVYDFIVDCDKRWQRCGLDRCLMSLLTRLLHSLNIGQLPHFFAQNHNLFARMPPRTLETVRTRVGYLVLNEMEIIRLLTKHSKTKST